MKKYDKLILAIGSIAVVTAVGFGGFAFMESSKTSPSISQPASSKVVETTNTSTGTSSTGAYKDGVYESTISYSVPRGYENSISVSLTVSGGVITAVNTTNNYTDQESGSYIDSFESGVDTAAVGKQISSASFSRIGGASVTTDAFQQAVEAIRSEASA